MFPYNTLPWIAIAAFIVLALAALSSISWARRTWIVPAFLSAAFLGWSIFAVIAQGALGFWTEHVRNAWGNQIWFDLLIGVGVAWTLLAPKARVAGMKPLPWLALILASGGIGLLAMLARYLYLRDRAQPLPQH